MTWSQFWAMGGFAPYVWSAYSFAGVVVLVNIVQPLIQKRKMWASLRRELDRAGEDE